MTSAAQKTVGVLGGMGPAATLDFMARVIDLTPAARDQDHVRMIVEHNPHVPSRQNVSPENSIRIRATLAGMARRLESSGADFLVVPCNSAHAWLDEALDAVTIPLVSIIEETVRAIRERCPDARAAGVLATPSCLQSGLYQHALERAGLTSVTPSSSTEVELMRLIDRIKAGDSSVQVSTAMVAIAGVLVDAGADVIIAGCTEIPLVLAASDLRVPLLSSTDELARSTVAIALGGRPLQAGPHPDP